DTPISKEITMLIQCENNDIVKELENERHYLERFCNPGKLVIAEEVNVPEKAMSDVVTGAQIYLPLEGLIDIDNEIASLEKELENERHYLERLCNTGKPVIAEEENVPKKAMSAVVTGAQNYLPLEGLINIDKENARLEKELEKWTKEVERVQTKLANENFVNK